MSPLTDPLGPDLKATRRTLMLGKLTATLPERLTLARQHNMPHADFLQLVLSDEVARREAGSIALRAKNAGLDPAMRTETWDPSAAIRYDQRLWNELVSLRFLDGPHGALILDNRRRRQDTPGHRPGPHRRPPPPHRPHGPRRQALQTPHRSPPRQHPRLRIPPPDHRRAAHHRRFRAAAPHPRPDHRLLRDHHRTPPQSLHRGHLQPRRQRMAPAHDRPAAGPVSHRQAHLHLPRAHRRRRLLPPPPAPRATRS